MKEWPLLKTEKVFRSKPFDVVKKTYLSQKTGKEFVASVLQMPNWVNIIPITEDNQVVLIKQFRFGTDNIQLEIPGGVIEEGEEPKSAAQRELEEETGYITEPENILLIGKVDSNPAIQNNTCYTFLARNVKPTGRQNFDPDELIELEVVPLKKIKELIKKEKITNSLIIAAFYWFFTSYEGKE